MEKQPDSVVDEVNREREKQEGISIARTAAKAIAGKMPDVSPEGVAFLRERVQQGKAVSDTARALVGNVEERERVQAVVGLDIFPPLIREYIENALSTLSEQERADAEREREKNAKRKEQNSDATFDPYAHRFDCFGVPHLTNRGYQRLQGRGKWWKKLGFDIDVGAILDEHANAEEDQGSEFVEGEMVEGDPEEVYEWDDSLLGIDNAAKIITDGLGACGSAFGKEFAFSTSGEVSEKQMVENLLTRLLAVKCEDGKLRAGAMSEFQHTAFVVGIYALRRAPYIIRKARKSSWVESFKAKAKGAYLWKFGGRKKRAPEPAEQQTAKPAEENFDIGSTEKEAA